MKMILMSIFFALVLSSCTIVQTPINGFLFVQTNAPTQVVSDNTLATKKGIACATGVIGIVTGDSSINAAAENGRIKMITHVDHTAKNILGVYAEYCTIVYGK